MLSVLPGVAAVVLITIVAGVIAYIGDRVGHQVGRKRLTLFGLRPKYTSTIVAVATGMLIALSVTVVALIGSNFVRTAFFRIGELNSQINQLQAQALEQGQEISTTRNANIVVAKGALLAQGAVVNVAQPESEQLRVFSAFFDDTVRSVNATGARAGLVKIKRKATDPKVRADLLTLLRAARDHYAVPGGTSQVLFLPIAPLNLFRGEPITFSLVPWPDKKLYGAGEEVASIDVEGGRTIAAPDYQALVTRATEALARRGFPYPFFASPPSGFDPVRFQAAMAELARVRGHFKLVARSERDLYPHSGAFVLAVSVEPRS
ncbi:MAG: hypothetical protein NVS3B7_01570 [Candidatus Elarobacter sp.]